VNYLVFLSFTFLFFILILSFEIYFSNISSIIKYDIITILIVQ